MRLFILLYNVVVLFYQSGAKKEIEKVARGILEKRGSKNYS